MAEKLKTVIPRQLFEVPIQAVVGGKIIAREPSQHLEKMYLQNAMVEILQERKSY